MKTTTAPRPNDSKPKRLCGDHLPPKKDAPTTNAIMEKETIRVLIADDHQVMRRGLCAVVESIPGWSVCGEAETGRQVVEMVAKLKPAIVVMDVTMPELNGLEATRQIKKDHPTTEVPMFTGHETEELARQVFEAGARS